MSSRSIYLYGCGGHAKVILDILKLCQQPIAAFLDDAPPATQSHIYGVPILHSEKLPSIRPDGSLWIVAIGNNAARKQIVENLSQRGHQFATAIHPSAQVSEHVNIGAGTVIMANSVVSVNSFIGQHSIVNTAAAVDHDCQVGDYVHIAPACTLCGGVSISEGAFLGVGTKVIPYTKVGQWSVCGAGSVVIKPVADHATVYGVPAIPQ